MRIFTLLIVAFLIIFSVSGQNIKWIKSFGSVNNDYSSFVVTDNFSNTWLFYTITDSSYSPTQKLLVKFDSEGNLLITDTFPLSLTINYIQRSNHSTFYILGLSNDSNLLLSGHPIYGNFIAEMDYNKNWLNVSRIFGGFEEVRDYKFDDTGNLYVAWTTQTVPHVSSVISKADLQGNFIYSNSTAPFSSNTAGIAVQPLSNGNCYSFIAGYRETQTCFNYLDSVGNLVSRIPFPFFHYYLKMTTDTSNNLYIMGNFTDSIQFGSITLNGSNNTDNLFVAKMDSHHNFMWALKLSCTGAIGSEIIKCYPINQRLYFTGSYTDSLYFNSNGYDSHDTGMYHTSMFLASVDLNGNTPWITTVSSSNSISPVSMAVNENGHILISGYYYDTLLVTPPLVSVTAGKADIFLMEIVDESIKIKDTLVKNSILVYPNPANKYITINLPEAKYSNVQLFNCSGEIVRLFSNQGNKFQIYVEDLSDGIYFIRAISEDNNPVSARIIVTHKN